MGRTTSKHPLFTDLRFFTRSWRNRWETSLRQFGEFTGCLPYVELPVNTVIFWEQEVCERRRLSGFLNRKYSDSLRMLIGGGKPHLHTEVWYMHMSRWASISMFRFIPMRPNYWVCNCNRWVWRALIGHAGKQK